jgi:hypothetical protein
MSRPSFATAWAISQRIYDASNSGAKVASVIGGAVAKNVNNPDPRQRWSNTCAVRMSYILNYSGTQVPKIAGETVSGADGKFYFFRVRNVVSFLRQRWGKPDAALTYPPSGGGPLADQKGLILFEVSGWGDAAGHATLWNGKSCYDHCYFNEVGATYRTTQANFWKLP